MWCFGERRERTGARERAGKVSGKEKAKKSGGRKGKETGVVRRLEGESCGVCWVGCGESVSR